MTGLTHQQARRLLNSAIDHSLDSQDCETLQVHLNQCARCRAYAQEVQWLDGAVGRALRLRWSAPRRSPIDTAGRVRRRLRANAKKQIALGIARTMVKIGSLAIVAVLVGGLLRVPTVTRHSRASIIGGGNNVGLPRFEFAADSDNSDSPGDASINTVDDSNVRPATPASRLNASQY